MCDTVLFLARTVEKHKLPVGEEFFGPSIFLRTNPGFIPEMKQFDFLMGRISKAPLRQRVKLLRPSP